MVGDRNTLVPLEEYLAELRDPNRAVVTSKLTRLSSLLTEEIQVFAKEWPRIGAARRRQIAARLGELAEGNPELDFDDVLRACLADPDSEVRGLAIEGLVHCEDRALIQPLTGLLLGDGEPSVRAAAASALGRFALLAELGKLSEVDSQRIEEALLHAYYSENEALEVYCSALEAIGVLSTPQVEDIIRKAYSNKNLEFRASAVHAMGRNCNPDWLPILLKELHSDHPLMRLEAVRACAELEAEEAVPRIIDLLEDSDAQVQVSAIEALGGIGGREAREALKGCLDSGEEIIRDLAEEALERLDFGEDPFAF